MAQARLALMLLAVCLFVLPAFGASSSGAKKPARPAWSELTPAQKQVLAPLEREWERLDTTRRRKWVTIANRYPKMKPLQQQRLQRRMNDWAKLTPEERQAAREKYQTLKKLPPDQRERFLRQWTEYQQSRATPAEDTQTAPASEPAATTN